MQFIKGGFPYQCGKLLGGSSAIWQKSFLEYEEMSAFHQTSPESGFTKRWICSIATPDGRVTLANGRLIVTAGERREERVLSTHEEVRQRLRELFAIEFDGFPKD